MDSVVQIPQLFLLTPKALKRDPKQDQKVTNVYSSKTINELHSLTDVLKSLERYRTRFTALSGPLRQISKQDVV